MNKIAVSLLLLTWTISSCKSCKPDPDPEGRFDLLINRKWQITAQTTKPANSDAVDTYATLPDYDKDDYFYFKNDSTYTLNANTLKKPGTTEDLLDYGRYKLPFAGIYIQVESEKVPAPQPKIFGLSTIEEINEKFLRVINFDSQGSVVVTVTTTYKRI